MRWCSIWPRSTTCAPHRFYLIGIGKDKEVAPNNTAEGRKQNRRVEVQLLSQHEQASDSTAAAPLASNWRLTTGSQQTGSLIDGAR